MNFKLGIRLLAFAAALCMAACDFEDINHNPHEPTDKDLEPDYYGTGLLHGPDDYATRLWWNPEQ